MMSSDLALLDTNVLVYAFYEDAEHHAAAKGLLDQASGQRAGFCVAAQTIAEFYAVVTNPRRVTAPKPPDVVLRVIDDILAMPGITLLATPADLVSRWTELVRHRPVTAKKVFDVQLVATMFGNGVRRIHTFNARDFEVFDDLEVLVPQAPRARRDSGP